MSEEEAPVEAAPPNKPASKPSVSEILAKAGVKLKPKQEQDGPRTAPPRQQQAMSEGMKHVGKCGNACQLEPVQL